MVDASAEPAVATVASTTDEQALRLGLTDALVTMLSRIAALTVRPTSATAPYLDRDYDVMAVGRDLRVKAVLEGTVQRLGQELRTSLQLVEVATGRVVWADEITTDADSALRGQRSLARRVSQVLSLNLADEPSGSWSEGQVSSNPDAQAAFLRGNLVFATAVNDVSQLAAARDAFEQAVRIDPNFALALALLANVYTSAGSMNLLAPHDVYPKAARAARRAIELDPRLAVAHSALAEVDADYNWDWAAADAGFARALALAPKSAVAHGTYAQFLARRGRFAEATTQADLAEALGATTFYDPMRALHYYYEHRFAEAIALSQRLLDRSPRWYLPLLYQTVSLVAMGDGAGALLPAQRAVALTGGAPSDLFVLGCAYARMNDDAHTDEVLARMTQLSRSGYVDPFYFAGIAAYRGDTTRAFADLERAYAAKSYWMSTLQVHPTMDGLRSDPRFQALIERVEARWSAP